MKTFTHYIIFLAWIIISSCAKEPDLSDITQKIKGLDNRLKQIEILVNNANSNIVGLEQLLEAIQTKKYLVEYNAIVNGYKLIMSDNTSITIFNGKHSAVGVQAFDDGKYYWTLNAKFMIDSNGDKILATGKHGLDGEEGITPLLRINAENLWEISLNKGVVWELVLNCEGNPVSAKGEQGTAASEDLQLIEKGNTLIIQIGKITSITVPFKGSQRPKLAIEYFSEYNIGTVPGKFADSHKNDAAGYYSLAEAFDAVPSGYHLPSRDELRAIFPGMLETGSNTDDETLFFVSFKVKSKHENRYEVIEINNVKKTYLNNYHNTGSNISYAIKFKGHGDQQHCAFRYELVNDLIENNRNSHLKITVRYLGPENNKTMKEVADEKFWVEPGAEYISRLFPASGYYEVESTSVKKLGQYGTYWSSSMFNRSSVYTASFSDKIVTNNTMPNHCDSYGNDLLYYTIRPISNK